MLFRSKNIINKPEKKILRSNLAMYRDGFLVAGLSPKALVTFGTVFIQFINFENNIISQFLILTFTWVFLDFLSLIFICRWMQ